jgi:hypothetical protein
LNRSQLDQLFKDADVILPKKRHYYIETNESHYVHAHEQEPLEITRRVIKEKYPKYLPAFEQVMKQRSAHYFNMMVMKKQPLDEYCSWLFAVLGDVENQVDYSNYSLYEQRVFGFISELLLDTWLLTHPEYRTVEVNRVFLEKQNWPLKIAKFLQRKIVGRRD